MKVGHIDASLFIIFDIFYDALKIVTYVILTLTCIADREVIRIRS